MRLSSLSSVDDSSTESKPLVSLIVPVYNTAEGPLRRCLQSLFEQDYRNIEFIIIDDGSNDSCISVLKDCLSAEPRAKVYEGSHKGVSSARNLGIDVAEGEWIAFADADDELEPDFISEALKVVFAEGVDFVCGSVDWLFQDSVPDKNGFSGEYCVVDEGRDLASASMQMLGHAKYKHFAGPDFRGRGPHAKLFSKDVLGDLRYDETISKGEDVLFNYKFIRRCHSMAIVDDLWYLYYQYSGSAAHSVELDPWEDSIDGILANCEDGESRLPFVSRCAYMTAQIIESLARSLDQREVRAKGKEILLFAAGRGCFSDECYRGFELSVWLSLYILLCKKGRYGLACWYWASKTRFRDRFMKTRLIDPDSISTVRRG